MKPMNRVLHSAGGAALAFFLAAGPAQAISDLSADICSDPTAAAQNVADHYEDESNRLDTSEFLEQDCAKLCKQMGRICDKTAKSDGKCIQEGDKFTHKLAKSLCGADKECKAAVKEAQSADKDDLKATLEEAGAICDTLEQECLAACTEGEVFPDGGIDLPL